MLAEQNRTTAVTIQPFDNGMHPSRSDQQHQQQRHPHRSHFIGGNNSSNGSSIDGNNSIHNGSSSSSGINSDTSRSTTPATTIVSTDGSSATRQSHYQKPKTESSWISFQENLTDNYLERGRRINGLQLPLHPLQVSGWVALFGFAVSTYFVLIPALHPDLQKPLYIIVSGLYLIHGCSHITALLIDPSDSELRKQSIKRIVPEFDRTKHAHVIENGRCHLCNIKTTNSRTKHCSVCNKCVSHFDHHCKWLNHCVGGRNYVAFLVCVVSAVIGVSVILATVIGELVLYYQKSDLLTIWSWTVTTSNLTADIIPTTITSANDTSVINEVDSISSAIFNESFFVTLNETTILPDTETVSNATEATYQVAHEFSRSTGINLHVTIFLTFISIIGILSAITVGLLLHLCFFHVYISFLGLTTYEYIRNQRQLENQNSLKKSIAKNTSNHNHNQINTNSTTNPPNKSTHANQLYFCSHVDPKNLIESHGATAAAYRSKSIHCCDTTMQYENSTHKAFYICSVLHDRPSPILVPSSMAHELTLNSSRTSRSKTFHCCSEYKHIVKSSEASSQMGGYNSGDETAPPTELSSSASTTTDGEFVKLIEQCTFCSFKLKTNKKSKVGASEANGSHAYNYRDDVDLEMARKRSWSCCSSNGPKSTDSDISDGPQIDTISASIDPKANRNHINHRLKFSYDEQQLNSNNGAKPMSQIGKLPAANGIIAKPRSRASLSTNLKSNGNGGGCSGSSSGGGSSSGKRTRAKRKAWPTRLQQMLRMFGRCQQPHSLNNSHHPHVNNANHSRQLPPSPRRTIKQNQIRPMDTLEQQCEELKQQRRQQMQQLHDTINMPANHAEQTDSESIENDEMVAVQKIAHQPPAPPPPVRRKINNATADIQELAESLSFVQNPSHHHHHNPSRASKHKEQIQKTQPPRPLLMVNRKRRKNIFRSPNLSPIHETGYSNPTSPKPYRHSATRATPQLSSDSSTSTPKFAHQHQ